MNKPEKLKQQKHTETQNGPNQNIAHFNLTVREFEVLKLTANGKTSVEIGNLLFISLPTVESHRSKILRKLNVGNMIEAVALAFRKGLIE